jgi:malonyl-CoA O-methyltransferase
VIASHRTILNATANSFQNAGALYPVVAERLLERMELIKLQPQHILELGGGTGNLTRLLQQRFANATCYAIDIADQRLSTIMPNKKLYSICADVNALPFANDSADFIIANLMAHWLPDQQRWLQEAKRVLKVNGLLLFSFFATDTLKEIGRSARPFCDMHDMGDLLVRVGFNDPILDSEKFTLEYDGVDDVVADLSATGEAALLLPIDSNHTRENTGEMQLTYEVVYAHAWKAAEPMTSKIDQEGMVTISLDQIKRRSYTIPKATDFSAF